MKFSKPIFRIAATGIIAFSLCSCGAGKYSERTSAIQTHLLGQEFEKASAEIDQNKFLNKEKNRLLYLLEKGKLAHLAGNYEESNRLFEEAYILIDDRIKSSVSQEIAAKLTNPMAEPYKGEDFEKVTLHYYKALNFFQMGNSAAALVEARRINIKLNELNSRYKKNKNKYAEDAFSQILQGMLYEARGDINNAFIAYRNATDLYLDNGGSYFGVPMPEQLKKDLLRTAKEMGFHNEYRRYSEMFKMPEYKGTENEAEAIVFWENGLGPVKDQTIITASGAGGAFVGSYDDGVLAIPIPAAVNIGINALAIPKYRQRKSYYQDAEILVNGKKYELDLAQDFYSVAKQCLRDRMLREVVDMATRFVVKKAASKGLGILADNLIGGVAGDVTELAADAAGAATEKTDTRNWQTLPATISYARVPLKEGADNIFVIKKYGPSSVDFDTLRIAYKKGLQLVNYFDLGKTTTGYVIPEQLYASEDFIPTNAIYEKQEAKLNALEGIISGTNGGNASKYENMVAYPVDEGTPGLGTVYIIRKGKFFAWASKIPVCFNGDRIFKIKNKSFQKIHLSPGKLTIKNPEKRKWGSNTIDLVVEPNKSYFISLEPIQGILKVTSEYFLLTKGEAMEYIETYKANGAEIKTKL